MGQELSLGVDRPLSLEQLVDDIEFNTQSYLKIRELSLTRGLPDAFFESLFSNWLRMELKSSSEALNFKLWNGPEISDESIFFMVALLIHNKHQLSSVLKPDFEVNFWGRFGFRFLAVLQQNLSLVQSLHLELLEIVCEFLRNGNFLFSVKEVIREGLVFFWKSEDVDFVKAYLKLLQNHMDLLAYADFNYALWERIDFFLQDIYFYRFRALAMFAESARSKAKNILSQYLSTERMVLEVALKSGVENYVVRSLKSFSSFLRAILHKTYFLTTFRHLETKIFHYLDLFLDENAMFGIATVFIEDKDSCKPYLEIFEIIELLSPYVSSDTVLKSWMGRCKDLLLAKCFSWDNKAKCSLIRALRTVCFRLGILAELNPMKDHLNVTRTFIRTHQLSFEEEELDTVFLTPMLELLTRTDEDFYVRLEAIKFVGALGVLNPKLQQDSLDKEDEIRYSLANEVVLAEGERWSRQDVVIKESHEHSGIAFFGKDNFELPLIPSAKDFEFKVVNLILLELLEFQSLSVADTVCVLKALGKLIDLAGKEYAYSCIRAYDVVHNLFNFDPRAIKSCRKLHESLIQVLSKLQLSIAKCDIPIGLEESRKLLRVVLKHFFLDFVESSCLLAGANLSLTLRHKCHDVSVHYFVLLRCQQYIESLNIYSIVRILEQEKQCILSVLRLMGRTLSCNACDAFYVLTPCVVLAERLYGQAEINAVYLWKTLVSVISLSSAHIHLLKNKCVDVETMEFEEVTEVEAPPFDNIQRDINEKAMFNLIELLEQEVKKLRWKQSSNEAVGHWNTVKENIEFIKVFCAALLRNSATEVLRLCAPVVEINGFAGDELFNAALANIVHNWSPVEQTGEPLLDKVSKLIVRIVELEPTRSELILNFMEYSDRAQLHTRMFKKPYLVMLAEREHQYEKAIRVLESNWFDNGFLTEVEEEKLILYYRKLRYPLYVKILEEASTKRSASLATREKYSFLSSEPPVTHIDERVVVLLNKFLRDRNKEYKVLTGLIFDTMRRYEVKAVEKFRLLEENTKCSRDLKPFVEHYGKQLKKNLDGHLMLVEKNVIMLKECISYREKLNFPFNTDSKSIWLELAQKFRKLGDEENYCIAMRKLGVPCIDEIIGTGKGEIIESMVLGANDSDVCFELVKYMWSERKSKSRRDVSKLVCRMLRSLSERLEKNWEKNRSILAKIYLKWTNITMHTYFSVHDIRGKDRQLSLQEYNNVPTYVKDIVLTEVENLLLRANELKPSRLKIQLRLCQYYEIAFTYRKQAILSYKDKNMFFDCSIERYRLAEIDCLSKLLGSLIECSLFCAGSKSSIAALRFFSLWSSLQSELRIELGGKYFVSEKLGQCVLPCSSIFVQLVSIARKLRDHKSKKLILWLIGECVCKLPQFLLFQFLVATSKKDISQNASKAETEAEKEFFTASRPIVKRVEEEHPLMYSEAVKLVQELTRVGITPLERWRNNLDKAKKYANGNLKKEMISVLQYQKGLYKQNLMQAGRIEYNFLRTSRRDIDKGFELLENYMGTGNEQALSQMWDHFFRVYYNAVRELKYMGDIRLEDVSVKLVETKESILCVPGACTPTSSTDIRIAGFVSDVKVLNSKQKPRKLIIKGSNGKYYPFLLKGSEDVRQDERIMQVFGLMNHLLTSTNLGKLADLNIIRFPVIPLSREVGLIGWVERSHTMRSRILEYRKQRNQEGDAELIELLGHSKYMQADVKEKSNILMSVTEKYDGMELADLLHICSKNSHEWLKRKTNFIVSLAVTSIVGAVLGIGDRHPSNLCIGFDSGKIMHLDFSDCFGKASYRELYPEIVPFRFTRMMRNALGMHLRTFCFVCEHTLKMMRKYQAELFALLEPFVYDPILDWFQDRMVFLRGLIKNDIVTNSIVGTLEVDSGETEVGCVLSRRAGILFTSAGYQYCTPSVMDHEHKTFAKILLRKMKLFLMGNNFTPNGTLSVEEQIQSLLSAAGNQSNLDKLYLGWFPFW